MHLNLGIPLTAQAAFASGWMLLWGAAAAIPIAIHLWNRRQQHETAWAAMQFLMAAIERHSRRLRIEQWLLLALRVAMLLLLALALADPQFMMATIETPQTVPRVHTVLVIDGSFSMGTRLGSESYFDRAKSEAREILRSARQGDGFTLLVMSSLPRRVIGNVVFDAADVADEIDVLELDHTSARLAPTLDAVREILDRTRDRHPRLDRQRVVFVTDLARTTWADVEVETIRAQLAALADIATLTVRDVSEANLTNLAVLDLSVATSSPTVRTSIPLSVTIKSFGPQRMSTSLDVLVDGVRIAQISLEVPPFGQVSRVVDYEFASPGEHIVEVQLADDLLSLDNRRWLSLPVLEAVRVLCVEGAEGDAQFVEVALEAGSASRTVQAEVIRESELLQTDLDAYHAVFLCNVGRLRPAEWQSLQSFVQSGGGLVVTLGDRVDAANYNESESSAGEGLILLPARLGDVVSDGPQRFTPLAYRHPVVAPFRGNERAGLLTTPTWRYFRLALSEDDHELALAFQNGDAALVLRRVGMGRSALYATAASSQSVDAGVDPPLLWSAWSVSPSFLPLVQETLQYVVAGRTTQRNLSVETPLLGLFANRSEAQNVVVIDPANEEAVVTVDYDRQPPRFSYVDTHRQGVYRVQVKDEPRFYAVNVDPHEGDLQGFDPNLLPSQFSALSESEPSSVRAETHILHLAARICLAGVLFLVLLETVLSRWFGQRGKQ